MKQLPYIDEHVISVDAGAADVWAALLAMACRQPADPATVQMPFFWLDEATPLKRLALNGRHPFSTYRLVFEIVGHDAAHTRLVARTWADFPGMSGRIYRALVIGTGGHRFAVRRMLRRVAAQAHRRRKEATRCSG